MWERILVCCALLALYSAAPPAHINRLALFPDKSAWCEAKNITQIVGHTGCQPQSIQNRACLGQCFSYSVPNTFPQSTSPWYTVIPACLHRRSGKCQRDSRVLLGQRLCGEVYVVWNIARLDKRVGPQVTLECPGNEETPHVDKLVERIFHCSCQSCSKDGGQEGAVMQLYPSESGLDTPSLSEALSGAQSHTQPHKDIHSQHVHSHTEHHALPHTSDGG